jgi:hypothetical protein
VSFRINRDACLLVLAELAFHEVNLGLGLPEEAFRVDPVGVREVLVQADDAAGQVCRLPALCTSWSWRTFTAWSSRRQPPRHNRPG